MFRGKICIITGASSGLGKALAICLAKDQAKLVLFSRNTTQLKEVSDTCQALGASCITVSGDVTQPHDCAHLIESTIQHFGKIDYLINNAGLSMWARFSDIKDLNVFETLIKTNYLGAVYCTHYALPYLQQSKGMIIAISSLQGKFAVPFHTGYVASKHALHGFFDTLRIEVQASGMDILIVAPSWLQDTHLRENALTETNGGATRFRHHQSKSGMPLEECCHHIMRAMLRRQRELLLPKKAILLTWIRAFFPKLGDWYINKRVKQEL